MRVWPRLSGCAAVRRKGSERPTARAAHSAVHCARGAERLESRTLLSAGAASEYVELGEVRRPAMSEVPVRTRGSVTSGVNSYDIEINVIGSLTPSQQAAFNTAATRWEQILTGDIIDAITSHGIVDDIVIDADAPFID